MEAKEVSAGDEWNDEIMHITIKQSGEQSGQLVVCIDISRLGNGHEDVHAIHDETVGFSARRFADGVDDVASKREVGLGRTGWRDGGPRGRGFAGTGIREPGRVQWLH